MKMYLRTSFGMLANFYTGDHSQPFQGIVQENGVAPPL